MPLLELLLLPAFPRFITLLGRRRGAASSEAAPAEADLRLDDYVQDAASWIRKLATDARFTGVAVLGHSEGSLIGMLALQISPTGAFISVAGTAEKGAAILRRQLQERLAPDLAARNEEILSSLEAGRAADDVPSPLAALYRPSVQPYLISWFRYSPVDEIAKLRVPCLLVQGGTDFQVLAGDAEKLHAANKACSLKVIAGMNHVMKTAPPDKQKQIASYNDPALPLDKELPQALVHFLSCAISPNGSMRMPRIGEATHRPRNCGHCPGWFPPVNDVPIPGTDDQVDSDSPPVHADDKP